MTRFTIATPAALIAAGALVLSSCSPSLSGSATTLPSSTSLTTAPSATPTVEPIVVPTPGVAGWTGLDWSAMALGIFDDSATYTTVRDVVRWQGGYVGVGSYREQIANPGSDGPFGMISAAFFRSADGLHWTIVQQGPAVAEGRQSQDQGIEVAYPARVVPLGNGLLALGDNPFGGGAPKLWQTEDGSTWTLVDSPTWREALANDMLISVAAGPAGVVVVGAAGSNCSGV